jgi:hypothetical protein
MRHGRRPLERKVDGQRIPVHDAAIIDRDQNGKPLVREIVSQTVTV